MVRGVSVGVLNWTHMIANWHEPLGQLCVSSLSFFPVWSNTTSLCLHCKMTHFPRYFDKESYLKLSKYMLKMSYFTRMGMTSLNWSFSRQISSHCSRSALQTEFLRTDCKNNSDEPQRNPRRWRLSASWGFNWDLPDNHRTIVLWRGLRRALNCAPIIPRVASLSGQAMWVFPAMY